MSGVDDDDNSDLEGEEAESSEEDIGAIDDEFDEELDDDDEPFEGDDEPDEDLKVVDEALSHKDQNARALAIRRAIEERLESKRMSKDLDYLDLDLDFDD